jgi:hypothetical protein
MNFHSPWTAPEPPCHARQAVSGCRFRMHDVPGLGRIVQVELSGRHDPDFWQEVRDILREEIPRRSPHFLVLDVRGLDCILGSAFLGGLVAGAVEMRKLGRLGATRILAKGEMATRLAKTVSLCKLEPVLGTVHGDLGSALLGMSRAHA